MRLVSQLAHGLDNPGFVSVLRLVDDAHARTPFGDRLADQQRNNGTTKADDRRKPQQHAQVQALRREVPVHAQQAGHDAQHHHHREVGHHKQNNALHEFSVNQMLPQQELHCAENWVRSR